MNAKEVIEKYLDKRKYDLCCSESIIVAANEYYDLNISEDVVKASGAFCGGSYDEGKCGLIQSSNIIIALMYYDTCAHESERMKELILEYRENFKKKFENISCSKLRETYRTEEDGCKYLIIDAFVNLTQFLDNLE